MPDQPAPQALSDRKRQACLKNLRKAWVAPRPPFQFTENRREASRANLRKAAEANRGRYRRTRKRLKASRANIQKAHQANHLHFRYTPARRAANLVTIRKAQTAPRTRESYDRSRFNHLQHGLTVRSLESTLRRLRENPKEFEAHAQRFRRVFAPADPTEDKLVREIADLSWRRLRLFKAQARWESDRLKKLFRRADFVQPLDAEHTRSRAMFLLSLLADFDHFFHYEQRQMAAIERQLRLLARLRAGGDPGFRFYSRESEKQRRRYRELLREERKIEEDERITDNLERFMRGDPEVVARVERAWAAARSES